MTPERFTINLGVSFTRFAGDPLKVLFIQSYLTLVKAWGLRGLIVVVCFGVFDFQGNAQSTIKDDAGYGISTLTSEIGRAHV